MPLFAFKPRPRLPADLPAPKIKAAIPKLERMLHELHAIDLDDWDRWRTVESAMHLEELMEGVEDSLAGIFGRRSLEYHRLINKLQRTETTHFETMLLDRTKYETIEAAERSLRSAILTLRTAIRLLYWKLDRMEKPGRASQFR